MKLYTTPPSILTLVTWVPQNRQGKLHLSLQNGGGLPHPLRSTGKHSTKVNRAFGPARSFSIVNPRGRQLKAQLYSSELSYRTVVLQSCSSFSRVYFCTLLEGGGAPPPFRSVQKSQSKGPPLSDFRTLLGGGWFILKKFFANAIYRWTKYYLICI